MLRRLRHLFYYWKGWPDESSASNLEEDLPWLRGCIDFGVLQRRFAKVEPPLEFQRVRGEQHPLRKIGVYMGRDGSLDIGPSLQELAPELARLRSACVGAIEGSAANVVERAESWLWPIAVDATTDSDLEAVVYFASRRQEAVTTAVVYERWRDSVYRRVAWLTERDCPELAERARTGKLSLEDAAGIIWNTDHHLRLLSFQDNEHAHIDATFLRTVEWLEIAGFDRWVEQAMEPLATGPDDGLDARAAIWLFYALRSDLVVRSAGQEALDVWIFKFIHGGYVKGEPWRQPNWTNPAERESHVGTAASLVFAWHRAHVGRAEHPSVQEALRLVMSSQLGNGGWPVIMGDSTGSVLATSVAIHALTLSRPVGWATLVEKAARWLQAEQNPLGYWYVEGGPTVMLTVLVLDSLALARGDCNATFKVTAPTKQTATSSDQAIPGDEMPADPDYNFLGESWHNPPFPECRSVSLDAVSVRQVGLLVAVATDLELRQALAAVTPQIRRRHVLKIPCENGTYYFGKFGVFPAAVVQCTMGSEGPSGATLTIDRAIADWNPRAVLMVGIAFGTNRRAQRPGDVLVARKLIPYELQRVGEDTHFRSAQPESNYVLLDRFRNAFDWRFRRPDGELCAQRQGAVLTGNKLIDDATFKRTLVHRFPDAIGGEMEGTGLWSASERKKTPWILVKGVCDWADGQKHGRYQELAAAAAVSLCEHVFSDERALDGL